MRQVFALFLLLLVSMQASATLLSFTDRATFESQLSSFQTLNFNDFFYRPLPSDYSYGDTTLNAGGGLYSSDDGDGGYLLGAENGGVIEIQIAAGHRAVGLDIGYLYEWAEQERLGYSITGSEGVIISKLGTNFRDTAPPVQSSGSFYGWISTDQDIIELSLYVYVPFVTAYGTIDNLTYDLPSYQPVPEPASIALMGVGLVGLGFARRKKRCNS